MTAARENAPVPGPGPRGDVLAVLAAAFAYLACAGGLFFYLPLAQLPIAVGLLPGVLARNAERAAAASAGTVIVLGALVRPAALAGAPLPVLALRLASMALIAGVTAYAAGYLASRSPRGAALASGAFVALVVANLWLSALAINETRVQDGMTLYDRLETMPAIGEKWSDAEFFIYVLARTRQGAGYYDAFRDGYRANATWGGEPRTLLNVRQPALFAFLGALPGGARSIVLAMLLVSSLGVLSGVAMAARFVPLPAAALGAAPVAAYSLYSAVQPWILESEPWAVALGLAAVALYVWSIPERPGWRRLVLAAAAGALLATAVREMMAFLLVAGVVSGVLARSRFRLLTWLTASAVWMVAFLLHASASKPILTRTGAAADWFSPALGNLAAALRYSTDYFPAAFVPCVLSLAGIAAALLVREPLARAFLATAVGVMLALLVLFANGGYDYAGQRHVYWGAALAPLLYALAPVALMEGVRRGFRAGAEALSSLPIRFC